MSINHKLHTSTATDIRCDLSNGNRNHTPRRPSFRHVLRDSCDRTRSLWGKFNGRQYLLCNDSPKTTRSDGSFSASTITPLYTSTFPTSTPSSFASINKKLIQASDGTTTYYTGLMYNIRLLVLNGAYCPWGNWRIMSESPKNER